MALLHSRALPWVPGSSGVFQSRSVGPLPATNTTPGKGAAPSGMTSVPSTVVDSRGQVISRAIMNEQASVGEPVRWLRSPFAEASRTQRGIGIRQISLRWISRVAAMSLPSGDMLGCMKFAESRVSWRGSPPLTGTTKS